MLNLLRRNLYFAPKEVKQTAYISTVRPILEYGSSVWSPNSEQLKDKIEVVQNNAAKFVLNRYPKKKNQWEQSSSALVEELGWDTLEWRRIKSRCCMAYNIINGHTLLQPDLLTRHPHAATARRPVRGCQEPTVGLKHQLVVPPTKTKSYEESFFINTPEVWNRYVTPVAAAAPSIDAFKAQF